MMINATLMKIILIICAAPQNVILIVITAPKYFRASMGTIKKLLKNCTNIQTFTITEIYEGLTKPTANDVYKQNREAETILAFE